MLANRLSECLRYCNFATRRFEDATRAFRSNRLMPLAKAVFPRSCHTELSNDVLVAFERFADERKILVAGRTIDEAIVQAELSRPKSILITDWNKSLFDGALTPETRGFIDEDGMPPWDCWLGIRPVANSVTGSCLVSWVPQWLSDEVDFGIRVDAAECLSWAEFAMDDHIAVKQWGASWG